MIPSSEDRREPENRQNHPSPPSVPGAAAATCYNHTDRSPKLKVPAAPTHRIRTHLSTWNHTSDSSTWICCSNVPNRGKTSGETSNPFIWSGSASDSTGGPGGVAEEENIWSPCSTCCHQHQRRIKDDEWWVDDGSMDGGSNMFELSSSRCFQLCAAGSFTCNIPSFLYINLFHLFILMNSLFFHFSFTKFGCSFFFFLHFESFYFFHLHIFQVLTFRKQALLKHRTLESKFHHTKKTWFMDSNYRSKEFYSRVHTAVHLSHRCEFIFSSEWASVNLHICFSSQSAHLWGQMFPQMFSVSIRLTELPDEFQLIFNLCCLQTGNKNKQKHWSFTSTKLYLSSTEQTADRPSANQPIAGLIIKTTSKNSMK